jgi:hypothetical protein
LEKRAEQVLPGSEGERMGEGGRREKETTQITYAHVNK